MALKKITDAELDGKGVTYLADRPRLGTTSLLKRKFEEVVRDAVIPTVNANVNEQVPINNVVPVAMATATRAEKKGIEAYTLALGNQADLAVTTATATRAEKKGIEAYTLALDAPAALAVARNASEVSGKSMEKAEAALFAVTGGAALVFSPVTGLYGTIQTALDDLYGAVRLYGVTADEYAAYGLTADRYAAYRMTADMYAVQAKVIIV